MSENRSSSHDDLVNRYYANIYSETHYNGSLGFFTRFYHTKLEKKINGVYQNVLEIGSGKGEHVEFVKHEFSNYQLLDIAEQNVKEKVPLYLRDRVSFKQGNAADLPFTESKFERCIATCVLLHIPNIEEVLLELRRVTKDQGIISLYLPCDPGMGYRWIRHFASHKKQQKALNISMKQTKYLWSLEHRNHFLGVLSALKLIFDEDQISIKRYPFYGLSWNFNLFIIITIRISKNA